jgi:hypothetical protein
VVAPRTFFTAAGSPAGPAPLAELPLRANERAAAHPYDDPRRSASCRRRAQPGPSIRREPRATQLRAGPVSSLDSPEPIVNPIVGSCWILEVRVDPRPQQVGLGLRYAQVDIPARPCLFKHREDVRGREPLCTNFMPVAVDRLAPAHGVHVELGARRVGRSVGGENIAGALCEFNGAPSTTWLT